MFRVWEDEDNLAFLSVQPIKDGHTLVIPKKHYPYLFDMKEADYLSLMKATQKVARILKEVFQPKTGKIGQIVYGLDIQHAHIHLSPIDKGGELNFSRARFVPMDQLAKVHQTILEYLKNNP